MGAHRRPVIGGFLRLIQVSPHSQARIWVGESVATFVASGCRRRRVRANPAQSLAAERIALELLVPRGARAEYGLVALELVRGGGASLEIDVPHSGPDEQAWPGSLAARVDDVRVGIPAECAAAILDSAASGADGRVPPGTLRIVGGAHARAGSSPVFFAKLTGCALELLLDRARADDGELARLLHARCVG